MMILMRRKMCVRIVTSVGLLVVRTKLGKGRYLILLYIIIATPEVNHHVEVRNVVAGSNHGMVKGFANRLELLSDCCPSCARRIHVRRILSSWGKGREVYVYMYLVECLGYLITWNLLTGRVRIHKWSLTY